MRSPPWLNREGTSFLEVLPPEDTMTKTKKAAGHEEEKKKGEGDTRVLGEEEKEEILLHQEDVRMTMAIVPEPQVEVPYTLASQSWRREEMAV